MTKRLYTTQLQAGLGMVEETRVLLDLWQPGMNATQLSGAVLESGQFPGVSARRLRNIIAECFAPRLLVDGGRLAIYLKSLGEALSTRDVEQILFVATCRANAIMADFVKQVYWPAYAAGHSRISNEDAHDFVVQANQQGLTAKPWAESTIRRVSGYLTGACADFGLLERGRKRVRDILPYRTEPRAAIALAYELHFAGMGDNTVMGHADWELFGMDRSDVIAEAKRLTLRGAFLVQTAGDVIRVGWQCKNVEELKSVIAES